jgi:uncharacterized coiled-coil protein SlyX
MKLSRISELQFRLNVLTSRKSKQEKLMQEVKKELGRIQDEIDELSKELISHINKSV